MALPASSWRASRFTWQNAMLCRHDLPTCGYDDAGLTPRLSSPSWLRQASNLARLGAPRGTSTLSVSFGASPQIHAQSQLMHTPIGAGSRAAQSRMQAAQDHSTGCICKRPCNVSLRMPKDASLLCTPCPATLSSSSTAHSQAMHTSFALSPALLHLVLVTQDLPGLPCQRTLLHKRPQQLDRDAPFATTHTYRRFCRYGARLHRRVHCAGRPCCPRGSLQPLCKQRQAMTGWQLPS